MELKVRSRIEGHGMELCDPGDGQVAGFVNVPLNLQAPGNLGNFVTSSATISFLRRLLSVVSQCTIFPNGRIFCVTKIIQCRVYVNEKMGIFNKFTISFRFALASFAYSIGCDYYILEIQFCSS
jgi:hypothetical protein